MSTYIYDSSGTLPANKIYNEPASVGSSNGIDHFMIKPLYAPFYGGSMSVVNSSGDTLTPGNEYHLVYHWDQASESVGKDIYGGIAIAPTIIDSFKLTYQTLGADYADNHPPSIVSGLVNLTVALEGDWESAPTAFPPTKHTEELLSIGGMVEILDELTKLKEAILQAPQSVPLENIDGIDTAFINPLLTELNNLVIAILNRPTKVINFEKEISDLTIGLSDLDGSVISRLDSLRKYAYYTAS